MIKRKNIVGKLINFRGLVYSPVEENGVIFLFSKLASDLNLYIETIRKGFPDCIAKRYVGKSQWEEVNIEFEFRSSHFKSHNHLQSMQKGAKCDMIVCWEHDWKDCPKEIEVLELKSEYLNYENYLVEEPDKESTIKQIEQDTLFKNYDNTKRLYKKFHDITRSIDKQIWAKTAKRGIFYYCPERVFFKVSIQKQGLKITLFTSGKNIKDVDVISEEGKYAQKWGTYYIFSDKDIPQSKAILKISLKRIREAMRKNENTGWYAEVD
jgi:predicted transport protein